MAPSSTLLLCLSLALLALASGYPFADDEEDFQNDGDLANLMTEDELENMFEPSPMVAGQEGIDQEGGEDEDDGLSAQDRLLEYYERARRGARWNKNFVGISSLDRSITAYTSFLPCKVEGVCKLKFKQTFRCKCNRHTYCVGPGRKYQARCRYSAVGHVFYQP
ncbi:uncharacterized protein [Diadema setosum]|uniref:uncharacterized protein n=1 Tax=Diadema setosum TaxID=31175 RepID=UPI003B3A7CA8